MWGNKFHPAAFFTGDLKCSYTLTIAVFLSFNFSFQTTCPRKTSLVSLFFIMMHRIQYLRTDNFMTNVCYIHTTATVLKQKSPMATFKVKNLFCGHIT
jgi:hypothetical protein